MINVWILLAITVERYIAICWPFHAAVMCSRRRAIKALFFILALAVAVNIPRFFEFEASRATSCRCFVLMAILLLIRLKR